MAPLPGMTFLSLASHTLLKYTEKRGSAKATVFLCWRSARGLDWRNPAGLGTGVLLV